MTGILALGISISLLALMAIILYWVIEIISSMPGSAKAICQLLIILIAVFSAILDILAYNSTGVVSSYRGTPTPSIIAPERQGH